MRDGTDLDGRVILTGPQVVAQWSNMEHYFSAVDNEVYGSDSKIYHNWSVGSASGPVPGVTSGRASLDRP